MERLLQRDRARARRTAWAAGICWFLAFIALPGSRLIEKAMRGADVPAPGYLRLLAPLLFLIAAACTAIWLVRSRSAERRRARARLQDLEECSDCPESDGDREPGEGGGGHASSSDI